MQDYVIQGIFPIPLYVSSLKNADSINKEIDLIINKVPRLNKLGWGNPHHLSTEDFAGDDISKFDLKLLHNAIDDNLKKYCEGIKYSYRKYARTSWFSFFEKGEYGQQHNHGFFDISGCYYYKSNTKDGDIYFESPAPAVKTSSVFNPCSGSRMNQQPIPGKLLLFPAFLEHGIMKNNTDNLRVSIAFNIKFNNEQK
jgi:hypothetical protein